MGKEMVKGKDKKSKNGGFLFLLVLSILSFGLSQQCVFASGYMVPEQCGKSTAMGGAFSAISDDLSAVYFNPAGLAFQKGKRAFTSFSASYIYDCHFNRAPDHISPHWRKATLQTDLIMAPFVAISDDLGLDRWTFAFSGFAPYGAIFNWPDDGPQRYLMRYERLYIVKVGPSAAYQARDNLSFGFGLFSVWSYYAIEVDLDALYSPGYTDILTESPKTRVPMKMHTSDKGYSYDLGILYKPSNWLSIGLHYVPGFTMKYMGKIKAKIPPDFQPIFGKFMLVDNTVVIHIPQYAQVGMAFQLSRKFLASLEAMWIDWSVMKSYHIQLKENPLKINLIEYPKEWDDMVEFRAGFEYSAGKSTAFRFGYLNDPSPIDNEHFWLDVPDCSKQAITLGVGQRVSDKAVLDFGYAHYFLKERRIRSSTQRPPMLGKFKVSYDIFSLSLNYKF